MPLVLVPLFVLSVDRRSPADAVSLGGVLLRRGVVGTVLRAFVVGTAPPGASTRGTRRPTAESLSTLGAYSIVRHPLYLANTLVALGCSLLSGTWYLPLIVLLLSFIYHERIAAREEVFLQSTFGDSFREWASEVPAMVPAFGTYRPSGVRVSAAQGRDAGVARLVRHRHGVSGARHARGLGATRLLPRRSRDGWWSSSRRSFHSCSSSSPRSRRSERRKYNDRHESSPRVGTPARVRSR